MMERTAQSFLMSQLHDLSVGVWKADGSTVAMPEGLLDQFLGTRFAIEHIREQFGDDLNPGDVILTNDPYHGGHAPHLPDWGFIRPIFCEGELVFFTLCRGHMMDTGGSFPGGYFPNAYDIHAEGLCIPPTQIIDRRRGARGRARADLQQRPLPRGDGGRLPGDDRHHGLRRAAHPRGDRALRARDRARLRGRDDRADRARRARRDRVDPRRHLHRRASATDDDGTVLDEPVWVRVEVTIARRRADARLLRQRRPAPGLRQPRLRGDVRDRGRLGDPAHGPGARRLTTTRARCGRSRSSPRRARCSTASTRPPSAAARSRSASRSRSRSPRRCPRRGPSGRSPPGASTAATTPPAPTRATAGPTSARRSTTTAAPGAVAGYDGATGPASFGCLGSVMRGNVEEAEVRFPWKVTKLEVRPRLHGRRALARRRRRRLARGEPRWPGAHGHRQLRRRRDGPGRASSAGATARRAEPSCSATTS